MTAQDGTGKLFMTMLAAFADWERNRIRDRIISAKEFGRETGRFLGGVWPFGYQIVESGGVKMLDPDPVEQAVIGEMRRRYAEGESLYRLHLWARSQGHMISSRTVHKILTAEAKRPRHKTARSTSSSSNFSRLISPIVRSTVGS